MTDRTRTHKHTRMLLQQQLDWCVSVLSSQACPAASCCLRRSSRSCRETATNRSCPSDLWPHEAPLGKLAQQIWALRIQTWRFWSPCFSSSISILWNVFYMMVNSFKTFQTWIPSFDYLFSLILLILTGYEWNVFTFIHTFVKLEFYNNKQVKEKDGKRYWCFQDWFHCSLFWNRTWRMSLFRSSQTCRNLEGTSWLPGPLSRDVDEWGPKKQLSSSCWRPVMVAGQLDKQKRLNTSPTNEFEVLFV